MKKQEYVAALRELADFVESREFPDSWKGNYSPENSFEKPRLIMFVGDKNDFGRIASALGSFQKTDSLSYITASKTLPSGAYIALDAEKKVTCTRKVVGTKIVPLQSEQYIPAIPEHTEDIVEWECPESFVALKEEANANS